LDRAIDNTKGASATRHRDNVIFSPLSVGVALSLVLLGSAGRTFNEVSRVLGLEAGVDISQHSEVVHQMFGLLLSFMDYRVTDSNGPRVNFASGIFVQVNTYLGKHIWVNTIIYRFCYNLKASRLRHLRFFLNMCLRDHSRLI